MKMPANILSKFKLDGKVAIVTGGGKGIGRAISFHYALVGAQVIVAELDQKAGESVAKEIQALNGKCSSIVTDVTSSEQVSKLVEATMKEFGRIDVFVNNVGKADALVPIVHMSEEDWDRSIKINLTSVFLCNKAVGLVMIAQKKGSIINIASAGGTRPVPGMAPYVTAKAGVINFTKTLSVELARYKIRVNCINPGSIDTELGAATRGSAEERVERSGILLGRIGQPEDVALAAIYLASDASDFVTGECITVMGGPYTKKGDTEMFISKFPEL